tara:strand:+ start:3036 stop:3290 length:255 start_codon:yes stop_codon:yes gene_type:complete
MVLEIKNININISSSAKLNRKSFIAYFFKNLRLKNIIIRPIINANIKFNEQFNKLLLAWSNLINDKAYTDRRRILRRNSCSSYQ